MESPKEFHGWWQEALLEGVSDRVLFEVLKRDHTDMGRCRQLLIAHHGGLSKEREALIKICLESHDYRVMLYAKSLDTYTQIAWDSAADGAYNSAASALLPGLRADLRQLQEAPFSPFSREVSCSIYMGLALGYAMQGKLQDALEAVSTGWYWAKQVNVPFCLERARSMQVGTLIEAGQVGEALTVLQAPEVSVVSQTTATQAYNIRVQGFLLSQMGRYDEGIALLKQSLPGPNEVEGGLLQNQLQRLKLLWGTGGLEATQQVEDRSEVEGQLAKSLKGLLRAKAEPPWGTFRQAQQEHLNAVLRIWAHPRQPQSYNWAKSISSWMQALAYLWLDHPDRALAILEEAHPQSEQALDLNLLHAGAELEVALQLKQPTTSLENALERLRSVFFSARNRDIASPEGLAKRLIFWHPLGAAFAAVVPHGIRELQGALEAVLRVGVQNTIHGHVIPPALATELSLRALHFDTNRHVAFTQADLGRSRAKRRLLQVKQDEYEYYAPVLSVASLVYGLVKLDESNRARTLYRDFGVAPVSAAEYKMQPVLENVNRAVQALLDKTLSVEAFTFAVLEDERI